MFFFITFLALCFAITLDVTAAAFNIPIRVILIPGNGAAAPSYGLPDTAPLLKAATINGNPIFDVRDGPWPDPFYARLANWTPYINMNYDEGNTIIAGSSTGALAAMRTMEAKKFLAGFLLSPGNQSNNDADEILSGWYPPQDGPWQYSAQVANTGSIWQFSGDNDPFISISNQLFVSSNLPGSTLLRYPLLASANAHLGDDTNIFNIIMNLTAPHLPSYTSSSGFTLPALLPVSLADGSLIVTNVAASAATSVSPTSSSSPASTSNSPATSAPASTVFPATTRRAGNSGSRAQSMSALIVVSVMFMISIM